MAGKSSARARAHHVGACPEIAFVIEFFINLPTMCGRYSLRTNTITVCTQRKRPDHYTISHILHYNIYPMHADDNN